MLTRPPLRAAAFLAACFGLSWAGPSLADGTAWLPEPGSGYTSLTLVHQSAGAFYRAARKTPTPGAADLEQTTAWLTANYALADDWSIDVRAGWAKSDFTTGPGIPTTSASFSGITDTSFGITRRLADEVLGPLPSIAVRIGGIAAGNYRTGQINSLGDGGSGYELSAIAGRFFGARIGLSGEVGYRYRDGRIPTEHYLNLAALWLVSDVVTVGVDYRAVDARSGLDIGEPAFSPARFPELEEDHASVGVRVYFNVGRTGFSAFHSRVVDGRNTADSRVLGMVMSRSFSAL